MEDYLAEVVMPQENVSDSEPESDIEDEVHVSSEPPMPAGEAAASEPEPEVEVVPEVKRKSKLEQHEIFDPPKVLPITGSEEPIIPGKKTRKKRGPPSEAQLERLRLGREKALANRRAKAELKKKAQEQDQEDKFLVEAVKSKQRSRLKKQLEDPHESEPPPQPKVIEKSVIVEKGYSQEQLDNAIALAVEQSVNKVEKQRKARKADKVAKMTKKDHDDIIFKNINQAAKTDVWADCFR